MNGIFGEHAPAYWDRGLSVIPLTPRSKQPAAGLTSWTGYCDNLPRVQTRAEWIRLYGDQGIGLCLGTIVGGLKIGAVDVDDDRFVHAVEAILGGAPSAKVGKKGKTIFVAVPVGAKARSTSLRTHEKHGAVDILLSGKMTVLPPSIHPHTRLPYRWMGRPLVDLSIGELPVLDDQKLALMKTITGSEEAAILTTGQMTHDAGLRLAARLVAMGQTDEKIEELFRALLPAGYDGDSLEELPEWIESARRKGFDQPKDNHPGSGSPKKTISEMVVGSMIEAGGELFHDPGKRAYMSVPVEGGVRHLPISSSEAGLWITHSFYKATGKALSGRALEEVQNLLEAKARFDGATLPVHLRIGGDASTIVIDLGRDDGQVVIIKPNGWSVGHSPNAKMIRATGFGRLPQPIAGPTSPPLQHLKELLSLGDDAWVTLLAFLLICLRPKGPYMLLLVEGGQGSGKSFLCSVVKRIIDPNQVERARLPESERDLMIHAQDYFLLSFDNVSGLKNNISDLLCVLATGGGMATRALYTDNELFVFQSARPMVFNGIADYASRPDLLERAIPLRLPEMIEGQRRSEEELTAELDRILPDVLGALYTIVSSAMLRLPDIETPTGLRMADCARWLVAAEPAAGVPQGSFLRAVIAAQTETLVDRTENDPVVAQLFAAVANHPVECTVQQLLQAILPISGPFDRFFPTTPAALSRHLTRIKPGMDKIGLHVEFGKRSNKGRSVRVWIDGQEELPFKPPLPEY